MLFQWDLKQNYSWLPRGVTNSILNITSTGRLTLIMALGIDGEYFGMLWSETVNAIAYSHFFLLSDML